MVKRHIYENLSKLLLTTALTLLFSIIAASIAYSEVTFTDVTSEAFPDGLAKGHYLWGDCDSDGDEDLLVGGKTIYINGGPPDFTFSKVVDTGDLQNGPHSRSLWIDIDNDGDLDIFGIGSGNNERLYRNNGNCTFTDISDFNGDGTYDDLGDGAPSTTASCGDYDADGYLDIYVGNYERYCGGSPLICADCMTDRLWHNVGNNTFEDVTPSSGIYDQEHAKAGKCSIAGTYCETDADCDPYPADSCKSGTCARGSNWVDYDNDGDIDIFVSNYRLDPNLLWENDGLGNFTEVAEIHNVDGDENSGSWGHVLGTDWADFDNDGDMDLYTANLAHCIYVVAYGHDISQLLDNGGSPNFNFTDIRPSSGMRQYNPDLAYCLSGVFPDWAETCPAWGDYDNDGDLDIYITHIYDSSSNNYSTLYSNNGNKTFNETSTSHGANLRLYKNYSTAWCDYDQDGDIDLITYGAPTATGTTEAHFYRNDGGNANNWLIVRVKGQPDKPTPPESGTNRYGVGVRISVTKAGTTQMREVQGGHGYHTAMNSAPQEFGFGSAGEAGTVEQVQIRWTTGDTDTFSNVPLGIRALAFEFGLNLRRGNDASVELPVIDPAAKLFPYADPVLDDGQTYYYKTDFADEMLMVSKDPDSSNVILYYR